jgi:hypothetical protein
MSPPERREPGAGNTGPSVEAATTQRDTLIVPDHRGASQQAKLETRVES